MPKEAPSAIGLETVPDSSSTARASASQHRRQAARSLLCLLCLWHFVACLEPFHAHTAA